MPLTDHGPMLSRAEAAKVFDRSVTWIDRRITQHALDAVKLETGRVMVTTASVAELSKRLAERKRSRRGAESAAKHHAHVQLVVDNTK